MCWYQQSTFYHHDFYILITEKYVYLLQVHKNAQKQWHFLCCCCHSWHWHDKKNLCEDFALNEALKTCRLNSKLMTSTLWRLLKSDSKQWSNLFIKTETLQSFVLSKQSTFLTMIVVLFFDILPLVCFVLDPQFCCWKTCCFDFPSAGPRTTFFFF